MRATALILGILLLTLGACGGDEPAEQEKPVAPVIPPGYHEITFNPVFKPGPLTAAMLEGGTATYHAPLLAAATSYKDYGNLDDIMRWAPGLCRRPPSARIRESASNDEGTHGKKLYWLYAKDRDAYLKAGKGVVQPVGQVLVKEAFVAQPGRGDGDPQQDGWKPLTPIVERDGKAYHAGAREALYIILKLDPKTPGTDQGWVYGTLTPDGKTVTSAGRVASCMQCHTENTNDRMFGLAPR